MTKMNIKMIPKSDRGPNGDLEDLIIVEMLGLKEMMVQMAKVNGV